MYSIATPYFPREAKHVYEGFMLNVNVPEKNTILNPHHEFIVVSGLGASNFGASLCFGERAVVKV